MTTADVNATTQTLRYYSADEVPESPGWTLVTRNGDGEMIAEDIITDERAEELRAVGVETD